MVKYSIFLGLLIINRCVYSWLGVYKKIYLRSTLLHTQKSCPPSSQANNEVHNSCQSNRNFMPTNPGLLSKITAPYIDNNVKNDEILGNSLLDSNSLLQPDRLSYNKFFESLSNKENMICLVSLCAHDDIRMLLDGQMIDESDIQGIWLEKLSQGATMAKLGSKSTRKQTSLNEQDSYEVLCSVMNLYCQPVSSGEKNTHTCDIVSSSSSTSEKQTSDYPTNKKSNTKKEKPKANQSDQSNAEIFSSIYNDAGNIDDNYVNDEPLSEDLRYLEQQYQYLIQSSATAEISWDVFVHWDEIEALIHDDYCSLDDVRQAWKEVAGTFTRSLDKDKFIQINRVLDAKIDVNADFGIEDEMMSLDTDNHHIIPTASSNGFTVDESLDMRSDSDNDMKSGIVTSLKDLNPWDPILDPKQVFDDAFISYLQNFFQANVMKSGASIGLLTYDSFSSWPDMKQLMKDGQVDGSCLKDLWMEALLEYQWLKPGGNKITTDRAPTMNDGMSHDTFIRMNIRLDMMMDEIEEALASLTDVEVEGYYRKEFATLSDNEELLSYQQLMTWADLKELIKDGSVTQQQLDDLWQALPKKPLGMYYRSNVNGFGMTKQSDGITVDAFLMFNEAIEDIESSEVM